MNTTYRERELRKNELRKNDAVCVVTHTAHPFSLQAISQLPAEIGFLGVLVCCSRRFACRESCYVNRQVSTYS